MVGFNLGWTAVARVGRVKMRFLSTFTALEDNGLSKFSPSGVA